MQDGSAPTSVGTEGTSTLHPAMDPGRRAPAGGRHHGHSGDLQADRLEGALGLAGGRAGGQHVVAHHDPDAAAAPQRAGAARARAAASSRPGWRPLGRVEAGLVDHTPAAGGAAGHARVVPAAASSRAARDRDRRGGVVAAGPDGGRARRHRHQHDRAPPRQLAAAAAAASSRGQRAGQPEQPRSLRPSTMPARHAVVGRAGPRLDQPRPAPGRPGRRRPARQRRRARRAQQAARAATADAAPPSSRSSAASSTVRSCGIDSRLDGGARPRAAQAAGGRGRSPRCGRPGRRQPT